MIIMSCDCYSIDTKVDGDQRSEKKQISVLNFTQYSKNITLNAGTISVIQQQFDYLLHKSLSFW